MSCTYEHGEVIVGINNHFCHRSSGRDAGFQGGLDFLHGMGRQEFLHELFEQCLLLPDVLGRRHDLLGLFRKSFNGELHDRFFVVVVDDFKFMSVESYGILAM